VLPAIMDISARATSLPDRPRTGHLGHQCSYAPGRPILHLVSSSRRPRQVTDVGVTSSITPHLAQFLCSYLRPAVPSFRPTFGPPSTARHSSRSGCHLICPGVFELALVAKDGPGDTGKLVGERDCQHVVVSRFLAASIQGLSPWRSQVFGLISTTQAACTNRTRR